MKYENFWKGLQAVCPDVDAARVKKLCDGMVDVFADNFTQGGLTFREFCWPCPLRLSLRLTL